MPRPEAWDEQPMPRSSRSSSKSRPARTEVPASAGRPIWQGQLRLSLVNVAVRLFPAVKSGARLSFHQVHKPSGKRIHYEKVVTGLGPVKTEDIWKGFELSNHDYVLLEEDELEKVKVEARHTLELVQFVDYGEIDPIYFEKPYYVVPDDELAEDAYRVLRDALRSKKKMGIGQFVMRGREYVGAIKPCGQGLLLETLRFADEVRSAAPLFADVGGEAPDEELLDLAGELIQRKSKPFKADAFKDSYTEALRALIDDKVKKRKTVEVEEDEGGDQHGGKVIDLVEALRRSVGSDDAPAGKPAAKRTSAAAKRTSGAAAAPAKGKGTTTRRKAG